MISDSHTRYGSRLRCHGRSCRPCARCHAIRRGAKSEGSIIGLCGWISALAARTKVRRALSLHDLSDRRTAYMARQPRAIVDEIVELEIAALAVAADEI